MVGALGDIHKDWRSVRTIMDRHRDVTAWLCVGDLGDDEGVYEEVPAPLYWIKGNNESFDYIAGLRADAPGNLRYLSNGVAVRIEGVSVAGVGGTFAPSWYDTDPAALPHPRKGTMKATALADKRRHFVKAEVEAAKAAGPGSVDVLLTHEAPRPFRVGRMDAGKTPINELIAALRPRLHLFGHHHRFVEQDVQDTRSICLDLVGRSYLLVDTDSWQYERLAVS
jgi:predicted phosphodiesterase